MGLLHLRLQWIREEAKAETQDGNLKQRPQRDTVSWLAPRLTFVYLSYDSQARAFHTCQQSRKYCSPPCPPGQTDGNNVSAEARCVKLASKKSRRKPLCSQVTPSVGGRDPAVPLCVPGQLCPAWSTPPSPQHLCSSHSAPEGLAEVLTFAL